MFIFPEPSVVDRHLELARLVLKEPSELCPNLTCHWLDCRCEACPSCEAIHEGPCVYMTSRAEDRLSYQGRVA